MTVETDKANPGQAWKTGRWPYLVMCLLAGLVIGFTLRDIMPYFNQLDKKYYEIRASGYTYINPLLDCESLESADQNSELQQFEHEIQREITERLNQGKASRVSVYFRDLNNGPWFSLGGEQHFFPASLLKVPFMMAVLKVAEKDAGILETRIRFTGARDFNGMQNIKPAKNLVPGQTYTVAELLFRMIAFSDNNSSALLEDFFGLEAMADVYRAVGIEGPFADDQQNRMTVEEYARFFRVLYNASFLNREMSEKALEYIAAVDQADGLLTAIPNDIRVAHKFGEEVIAGAGLTQLHECGIVYFPEHPYLLCVMSSGDSFDDLDEVIMEISHIVYSNIVKQHPRS